MLGVFIYSNWIRPKTFIPATGKVRRGKQGQLKVFAYVPLLCDLMNLLWRWILVALRAQTLKQMATA